MAQNVDKFSKIHIWGGKSLLEYQYSVDLWKSENLGHPSPKKEVKNYKKSAARCQVKGNFNPNVNLYDLLYIF